MDTQGIGRVKIISVDQQFSMLMSGERLADIGRDFTHVVRANSGQRDSLMLELDDKDSLEFVKVMVENNGVEEHTYQIMGGVNDILLFDEQAFNKLMLSSSHVRKYIQILRIQLS